jgi:arylsulfatase A-like enzyme
MAATATGRPPNIVVLITDQQRATRHWPEDPGWLRGLMPNEAELERTALRFTNAFCNTAMCSPSRSTLFTGLYPARHGVPLTLTAADLKPDPRNTPAVVRELAGILRRPGAPRRRALEGFARGALRRTTGGGEPELSPSIPNLAGMLRSAGYEVAYKGKWHLTQPLDPSGWSQRDSEMIERDFGFADWDPPDAGENAKADNFGGGNAGPLGQGWDEVYMRGVERWLGRSDLPEPFCLVVSLVNPHDVLGFPASYERGGYSDASFRDLAVGLPPTIDEDLSSKPSTHTLMQMGMIAYMGALSSRRAQLDYVNFYAYLHQVVDHHIGRLLACLGDPASPDSLRARTVIVRTSDHGEMGLSHGGLRQKAFNVYEETIHVPLVVSNPVLFPQPAETPALASLIDVLPTIATLAGADPPAEIQGRDLSPVLARHAAPASDRDADGVFYAALDGHSGPAESVQDSLHFTYDDHQAATAMADAPGQPNRVRCVHDGRRKYAVYLDPNGKVPAEYEMYDLERDPDERHNLLDVHSGEAREPGDRALREEMAERLTATMAEHGTAVPGARSPI